MFSSDKYFIPGLVKIGPLGQEIESETDIMSNHKPTTFVLRKENTLQCLLCYRI
jgi:hypothetical protein